MKKSNLRKIILITSIVTLFLFSFISQVYAAASPDELITQQTGLDVNKLPKNPEDVKNQYLKQEWAKIITGLPIIGPIHNFLSTNETAILVFRIIFGKAYEFSLLFLAILLLWLFTMTIISDLLRGNLITKKPLVKGKITLLIGAGMAIIFAQPKVGIISSLASYLIDLIFSQESLWARTLIILVIIVIFFVISQGARMNAIKAKQERLKQEQEALKHRMALVEAEQEGEDMVSSLS